VAILCLMRYEGWTYHEAVVRLAEYRELQKALYLARVPHFTTLQKVLLWWPAGQRLPGWGGVGRSRL